MSIELGLSRFLKQVWSWTKLWESFLHKNSDILGSASSSLQQEWTYRRFTYKYRGHNLHVLHILLAVFCFLIVNFKNRLTSIKWKKMWNLWHIGSEITIKTFNRLSIKTPMTNLAYMKRTLLNYLSELFNFLFVGFFVSLCYLSFLGILNAEIGFIEITF